MTTNSIVCPACEGDCDFLCGRCNGFGCESCDHGARACDECNGLGTVWPETLEEKRLASCEKRWDEAKPCARCKTLVIWRKEDGRSMPIDKHGLAHACP